MFEDRRHAGRLLTERLADMAVDEPLVIGLPRGGLPVAAEVADTLQTPLDVVVVRRLSHPTQTDLGLGAIAKGGFRIVNDDLAARLGVSVPVLDRVTLEEVRELQREARRYRHGRPPLSVAGRTVIMVDDGIATGLTARTGVGALQARGADRIILAVPVAAPETAPELNQLVDEFICLDQPQWFFSIGEFYDHFPPVTDDDVTELLDHAATRWLAQPRGR